MSQPRLVTVTGATGQQGGAVTRALLARGHRVRALVRAPGSPAAESLRHAGVDLVIGNLEDPASLDRALVGADALFGVTTPFEGIAAEAEKGMALVDAARRAGIAHLVYTSACNADRNTGIPSFETKLRVEQHLRSSGVPFTLIAPVYFMENLLTPFSLSRLRQGEYARWLPLNRRLQLIAVDDIGRFCVHAFEQWEAFLGRRIDIAGDELDAREAASVLSRVLRRELHPVALPLESFPATGEQGRNTVALLSWLAHTSFSADVQGLRRQFPEVGWQTLEQWGASRDWSAA
ncbi:NmrA/HSCARG family protein [Hyalangium sp.]|uniref:NmrA/HSCARG family protein n=1 Tax=Hyalangium sp. TaxID=2028555 RepID=UPI002D3C54B5|nr:NmrA/HSCARG family protein [Hyalangium sp.]HYI03146.1 NmrA/HSCARG family protein [Hyalangium sp.]